MSGGALRNRWVGTWRMLSFQPSYRRVSKWEKTFTLCRVFNVEKEKSWEGLFLTKHKLWWLCKSHEGCLWKKAKGTLGYMWPQQGVCHGLNLLLDDIMKLAFHQRTQRRAKMLWNMQKPLIAAVFEKNRQRTKSSHWSCAAKPLIRLDDLLFDYLLRKMKQLFKQVP